jgi:hypothetical protein
MLGAHTGRPNVEVFGGRQMGADKVTRRVLLTAEA